MPWELIGGALTAAELLAKITESSSAIRQFAKRLRYRVKNGKAIIPVFGAGGVGKSTVANLFESRDPLSLTATYTPSSGTEERKLKGDVPGLLIAAPGQPTRIPKHWQTLQKRLVTGESFGFINVVAYGYHSLEVGSYKEHDLYQAGMTAADFSKKYAEAMRKLELELLETLLGGLSAGTPQWMITMVSKQDLWWHDRTAVQKHYAGDYSAKIAALEKRVGSANFQHEFAPVSFTQVNLTSDGDALAEVNRGYDNVTWLRYLEAMYSAVYERLMEGKKK